MIWTTSDTLLRLYKSYYYLPTPSRRDDLLGGIISYDFSHYHETMTEIAGLKTYFCENYTSVKDVSIVKSNGSSGTSPSTYPFWPDFPYLCPKLEHHLRGCDVQLRVSHFGGTLFVRPLVKSYRKNEFTVHLDLNSPNNRSSLHDIVKRLSDAYSATVTVCASPAVWLLASTCPEISQFFSEVSPWIRSLVNEGYTLWKKSGVIDDLFMNDQMIDWKTGVNFYTCTQGTRHFFPLFAIGVGDSSPLLNMKIDRIQTSDVVRFAGERQMCGCGRYFIPFDIIPHAKNATDIPRSFVENLSVPYTNLQFIEWKDTTFLAYATFPPRIDDDIEMIIGSIPDDRHVEILPEKWYMVGSKRYNFWKETDGLRRFDDFPPPFSQFTPLL